MAVAYFLLGLLIKFVVVVVFFIINVALIRLIMNKFFPPQKNKNAASIQVAFWVTLVAFLLSFYMHVPFVRFVSAFAINAAYILAVKFYYFLDYRGALLSWIAWLGFYVVAGLVFAVLR